MPWQVAVEATGAPTINGRTISVFADATGYLMKGFPEDFQFGIEGVHVLNGEIRIVLMDSGEEGGEGGVVGVIKRIKIAGEAFVGCMI